MEMTEGDGVAAHPPARPAYPLPFRGPAPDRTAWVLEHATSFDPEHWRPYLGDDAFLPPEFAALRTDARGYRVITRGDVHKIAKRATEPLGALHTYVAAAAWGSGKRPARPRRVFDGDRGRAWTVAEKLKVAAEELASAGPVAAYRAMDVGGAAYTPGLRAAFATKFLHYAGYARTRPQKRCPLILDSHVALALNRLLDLGWGSFGWTGDQYGWYLGLAADWAARWDDSAPDVIERVLFSIGQSESLAVAALTGLPAR